MASPPPPRTRQLLAKTNGTILQCGAIIYFVQEGHGRDTPNLRVQVHIRSYITDGLIAMKYTLRLGQPSPSRGWVPQQVHAFPLQVFILDAFKRNTLTSGNAVISRGHYAYVRGYLCARALFFFCFSV